jgi:ribonuclease-3
VTHPKLGIKFKHEGLLAQAMTHRSYAHEQKMPLEQSNERLEFLGDAVLGICIAEMLVHAFPQETEGALSKRRAALVNQKQLALIAENLELGSALRLGKGEEKTGGRTKKSILCDAFEAVIGAVYLDQGMQAAQAYIEKVFSPLLPESKRVETSRDYKTRLQEHFQSEYRRSPRYTVVSETGPDHSKTFEVKIEFNGETLASGKGSSKREAEQDAAAKAFKILRIEEQPPAPKKSRKSRARAQKKQEALAQQKLREKEKLK